MFISVSELNRLIETSYMYRDLPMAVVFYRELKRKGVLQLKNIPLSIFYNFYHRIMHPRIEVLFPDGSSLVFAFDIRVIYAFHPIISFSEEYDF